MGGAKKSVAEGDEQFQPLMFVAFSDGTIIITQPSDARWAILSVIFDDKLFKHHFDLEKANKLFKATGKLGEELVNKYFESLKAQGQILNFTWYNKSLEQGLPYDFTVQENNHQVIHLDVKSTSYKFEQPMIFSGQEIDFITTTPNYSIYRVYNLSDEANPHLRVCDNSKPFAAAIVPHITDFKNNLQALNVYLPSVKFAVAPTIGNLTFGDEIDLY